MSIPLDRLYHHIESVAKEIHNDNVLIYRFWPHGSKKISDLCPLRDHTWKELLTSLAVYCHDQEPLNFDSWMDLENPIRELLEKYNSNLIPNIKQHANIYDHIILLHSEKKSSQLEKFENNFFITVYYWSHALIARDWFRYAKHTTFKKQTSKKFLIYNRAWAGTREYRLKFSELLVKLNLIKDCKTSINSKDPELGIHYNCYKFSNPIWKPTLVLENYFTVNPTPSYAIADFDIDDYNSTDIEVVLETLFDDARLHLTEKSLRPIACKQPFIIVGPAGSLKYLQDYGFKTFDSIWDETYDQINDPAERLNHIVKLMKDISEWDSNIYYDKMQQAQKIANFNQTHFFSQTFFENVMLELKNNLEDGFKKLKEKNTSKRFLDLIQGLFCHQDLINTLTDKTKNPMLLHMPSDSKIRSDFWDLRVLNKIIEQATQLHNKSQNC